MKTPSNGILMRILIGDSDRWRDHKPLHEAIVERARLEGLAGATVFRGILGFGKHSRIHSADILTLSTDMPIVIEIVDTEENIKRFMPIVDEMVDEGMVTHETVNVIKYAAGESE